MRLIAPKWRVGVFVTVICSLITTPSALRAERLPIKTWSTADGLVRDRVTRIRRDSRGFLWFCTADGLSRFDGYEFKNYTVNEGLPHRLVVDFLETREGVYWVATLGGLARFNPSGVPKNKTSMGDASKASGEEPMFVVYPLPPEEVRTYSALAEDRTGAVWWGTRGAVFRLLRNGQNWKLEAVDIGAAEFGAEIYNIIEDRQGALWFGTTNGLVRRTPDGKVTRFTTEHGLPNNTIRGLWEDADGTIWLGTFNGVCQLQAPGNAAALTVLRRFGLNDGLPVIWCNWIHRDTQNRLWVATTEGVSLLLPERDKAGRWFKTYSSAEGLSDKYVWSIGEDREGNLWLTGTGGIARLARDGFTTWRQDDGLGSSNILAIRETLKGELIMTGVTPQGRFLSRYDGEKFIATKPFFSRPVFDYGGEIHQNNLQDHTGEWWIPTAQGVFRYPAGARIEDLAKTRPKAVYGTQQGLGSDFIYRVAEDAQGNIWMSVAFGKHQLTRWERATNQFTHFGAELGLPDAPAVAFADDGTGKMWVAFLSGEIARYSYATGKFTVTKLVTGQYYRVIISLFLDRQGRMWIGTGDKGLLRVDEPGAEKVQFTSYTTAEGLLTNEVWQVTEDRWGNIWCGTGRGVARLNPTTQQIRHYGLADGLAGTFVQVVYQDQQGVLWFGTTQGLSCLVPQPDAPTSAPSIFINGFVVAGEHWKVSELGERQVPTQALSANQNQIQINFFGFNFLGEPLKYQYKLEGQVNEWSAPINQRSLNFSLSPGTYRFLVRAITSDGTMSAEPASIAFTIQRPLWQRWWFILLALLFIGAAIYFGNRYHVARMIEIERVRTRIATDLHDDIGASLSRMAILSEVVKQQNGHQSQSAQMLTDIADSARGLVDSMSDIVWSIDPRRDDLQHVVSRVRQYASDVLEAQNIAWKFTAPEELESIKLGPDQRRHLYLILKEAINNTAKHAQCDNVAISLFVQGNQLTVEVSDDGKGFEISQAGGQTRGGNGLKNLRARATELQGDLQIDSAPGKGTRLTLQVPL